MICGISFATVQIKEHFYCTNPKRCAIQVLAWLKNRAHNKGIKGKNNPIHSNYITSQNEIRRRLCPPSDFNVLEAVARPVYLLIG